MYKWVDMYTYTHTHIHTHTQCHAYSIAIGMSQLVISLGIVDGGGCTLFFFSLPWR